jgi:hypothetical protein
MPLDRAGERAILLRMSLSELGSQALLDGEQALETP